MQHLKFLSWNCRPIKLDALYFIDHLLTLSLFLHFIFNNKHALLSNKTFDITYIIPVLLGLAVHTATWKLMKSSVLYYSAMRITFIYQPQETSLCAMIRFLKRGEADKFSEEVLPSLSIGVCYSSPQTASLGFYNLMRNMKKSIPMPKDRFEFLFVFSQKKLAW